MRTHHRERRLPTLTVLALAAMLSWGQGGCDSATSENTDSGSGQGVPVEVVRVRPENLHETVRGIGTLRAAETVEIKPEIDGLIHAIPFEEGGRVEKEELLFSIDDTKPAHQLAAGQAALRAAHVQLANTRRLFNRLRDLIERNAADQDEYDQAETNYRAAVAEVDRLEAEVELAKAHLEDTLLRAPFDGVISERLVDVGDYAQAGDHLATLFRVAQMEITFTLPERFMGRVRAGQAVMVRVSAYTNRRFAGRVYFVSPQVDESTRDFLVKATVKNLEGLLKPGCFGTAVVTLEVREQRPVIPEEALVATRQGYIVFVVEGDAARRREVRIGLRQAGLVEIYEGLALGESVVRAGHMNLSDGVGIRVVAGGGGPAAQKPPPGAESDQR